MVEVSFQYKKRQIHYHYSETDFKLTQELAEALKKEMGTDLLKAVVLFGSGARGTAVQSSDVDVLLLLNDLEIVFSNEVLTSLRVLIETVASKISNTFHITTMHLSEFFDYARIGDPIIINILREGNVAYDSGFFSPLQALLDAGKIRPSKEAVWAYYLRAPKTLKKAESLLLQILVELYWATIDSAHAALMHIGVTPGAPHKVAELLEKHFVRKGLLDKKYVQILRMFYDLAKEIGHDHLTKISGKDVDKYILQANDFVKRMKFLVNHQPSTLM